MEAIHLKNKLSKIQEKWSPHIIASMNDYHLKLAKIEDEFIWHSHENTDEVFLVIEGSMTLFFRDGEVNLTAGELYVVPKGKEHKPVADGTCSILLIEHEETVNTGNEQSELRRDNLPWI